MWIAAIFSAKEIRKATLIPGSLLVQTFFLAPSLLLSMGCIYSNKPPTARKDPVKDCFHGIAVTDEYRWLEDWSNPQVQQWSEKQNAYARTFLDHLSQAAKIRRQVTDLLTNLADELLQSEMKSNKRTDYFFWLKRIHSIGR